MPAGLSCRVLAIATSSQPQPRVPPATTGDGSAVFFLGCSLPSPLPCLCQQLLVRTRVLPPCLPQFVPPVQGRCDWSPWCSAGPGLVAELALVWFFIECWRLQFATWKLKFFLPVIQCPYPRLVLAALFYIYIYFFFSFKPGSAFDPKMLTRITRQIKRMQGRKTNTSAI